MTLTNQEYETATSAVKFTAKIDAFKMNQTNSYARKYVEIGSKHTLG